MPFPKRNSLFLLVLVTVLPLLGCAPRSSKETPAGTGSSSPTVTGVPRNVVLTWTANREKAVNSTGGGYYVYYSTAAGFSVPSATYVNVPYSSGASTPTTATVRLNPGTYYFRVAAYSTLKALSGGSSTITVVVP